MRPVRSDAFQIFQHRMRVCLHGCVRVCVIMLRVCCMSVVEVHTNLDIDPQNVAVDGRGSGPVFARDGRIPVNEVGLATPTTEG